jgi:hypothetical protein
MSSNTIPNCLITYKLALSVLDSKPLQTKLHANLQVCFIFHTKNNHNLKSAMHCYEFRKKWGITCHIHTVVSL